MNFERLEDRVLMAANVVQQGGLVTISADSAVDLIVVQGTGAGTITVTVNGGIPLNYAGVTDIAITGDGGNDRINVEHLNITGGLTVDGGANSDRINLRNLKLGGDLNVIGGTGFDLITLANAGVVNPLVGQNTIGGDIIIDAGKGAGDMISMASSGGFGTTVAGNVQLLNAADYNISMTGVSALPDEATDLTVTGSMLIKTTVANNVGGAAATMMVRNVNVDGDLNIQTGDVVDVVTLVAVHVAGNTSVSLGAGADQFVAHQSVASLFEGSFALDGGADADVVVLNQAVNVFTFAPVLTNI